MELNKALLGGVIALVVAVLGINGFLTGTGYAVGVGTGGSLLVTVVTAIIAITLLGRYFRVLG